MLKLLNIILLLFSLPSFAQTVDAIYQGESEQTIKTQARQEIMEQAVENTSLKYIKEILGENKTSRNLDVIKNKIIKQSGKYTLLIRPDQLTRSEQAPYKYMTDVSLKMSLDNLRKLLLLNGLLYKTEGAPKILPLIVFDDRNNSESFVWWTQPKRQLFLKSELKGLHGKLKSEFAKKQFFSMLPIADSYAEMLPQSLSVENPRLNGLQRISEFFDAQIIIKGLVKLSSSKTFTDQQNITIALTAYQAANGRLIGDVKRQYKTNPGLFRDIVHKKLSQVEDSIVSDLVSQVYSAWQKGTFGSTLLKVTVHGEMTYQEMIRFKTKLSHLKEIRAIRERFISRDQVSYEVDSSALPMTLAKAIVKVQTDDHALKIDNIKTSHVEFDLNLDDSQTLSC